MVWDFSDLNSNFYEFLKLQPFSGIFYNKQKGCSRDDRHAAHSPSAREGLPGVIRGAAGRHPGGLWLGLTRDTRRNRRVPGEICFAGHVALSEASGESHSLVSRRTRGFREVYVRHSERVASSGGFRRDFPQGAFGDTWRLRKNPGGKVFRSALGNTWHVPRTFRRRLSG